MASVLGPRTFYGRTCAIRVRLDALPTGIDAGRKWLRSIINQLELGPTAVGGRGTTRLEVVPNSSKYGVVVQDPHNARGGGRGGRIDSKENVLLWVVSVRVGVCQHVKTFLGAFNRMEWRTTNRTG